MAEDSKGISLSAWLIKIDNVVVILLFLILIFFIAACFIIDYRWLVDEVTIRRHTGKLLHDIYLDIPVILLSAYHVLIRTRLALTRWGIKRDRLINTLLILVGVLITALVVYVNVK